MAHGFTARSVLRVAAGAAFALLAGCSTAPSIAPDPARTGATSTTTSSPAIERPVAVSSSCEAAMVAAGAVSEPNGAEPLIVATLSKCSTADEWYAGLRAHPEAFGLTPRAKIGVNDMELRNTCYRNEQMPVCIDAAKHGRL